jgi:hypothetical protein
MLFWENRTTSPIHTQALRLAPLASATLMAEYYILGRSTGYWSFFSTICFLPHAFLHTTKRTIFSMQRTSTYYLPSNWRGTYTVTCLSPAISIAPGETQMPLPVYEQYNLLGMKGHSSHTTPNGLRHHIRSRAQNWRHYLFFPCLQIPVT